MNDAEWDLDVAPTAAENYEAMTIAGRAMLNVRQRMVLILQSVFVGICAPMGATMMVWGIVMAFGGREFAKLPAWALPVSFVIFALISLWLTRQAYFMIADISARSRFGRSQQIKLNQTGITIITAISRWQSGWADVELVRSGKTVIAVCISGVAITLPRHAFLGPQDADEAVSVMLSWQEATR